MTLKVPQDSYVSVAAADAYHGLRPSAAAWQAMDEAVKAQMLVAASDYLDATYRLKNDLNAAMRSGEVAVLPEVAKAVCELAMQQQLTANEKPKQHSVKVGEIAVTYAQPDGKAERFAYVAALLAGLMAHQGVRNIPIQRG